MKSIRSVLSLGCPLRFRDRWQGRLVALEVDDQWVVVNLVLWRGLFRPVKVKLPFSVAGDWDDDAVCLDCTSGEAFGRRIPPVAVPPRPLSARTPLSVGDARLAGVMVQRPARRVSHLIFSRGLLASDKRIAPITDTTLEGGVIKVGAQSHSLPVYRRDSALLEAVGQALSAHPHLTADDRRALRVEVVDAVAYLSGNVRTPRAKANLCGAAASVPAVTAVKDSVVDDQQLEIDTGRALDAAGLSRHARVYIRSALGAVTLSGFVTTDAAIPHILKVASAVPGVRSVEDRLEVQAAAAADGAPPAAPTAPSG